MADDWRRPIKTGTVCGRLVALLLGLAFPSLVAAGDEWPPPAFYSAKEIRATLADEDSGQPLAGVVVVAQWVLWVAGPGGHGPRLHVLETVTDSAGQFSFPGWGPKPNPRYPFTRLNDRDPLLSFFKAGYRPRTVQNRWERNESVRFSEWDRKTITLKRFEGTDEQWARELRNFQGHLGWLLANWDWRLLPRMVLAVESERLALERRGLNVAVPPSQIDGRETTAEDVRRFLEDRK